MNRTKSILIVDDNNNFVNRILLLLESLKQQLQFRVANNYEEAYQFLTTEQPSLVLLDINLPGKNGIELLKFIKGINSRIEVIMITNHVDEYYRKQCMSLGASCFLDKSNEFSQVPELIDFLLKKSSIK